jgi:hypothetical protein
LESYEEASRARLARIQCEVSLWSELANKLGATRSVPEALETYAKCVSQRMQMAVDEGGDWPKKRRSFRKRSQSHWAMASRGLQPRKETNERAPNVGYERQN